MVRRGPVDWSLDYVEVLAVRSRGHVCSKADNSSFSQRLVCFPRGAAGEGLAKCAVFVTGHAFVSRSVFSRVLLRDLLIAVVQCDKVPLIPILASSLMFTGFV